MYFCLAFSLQMLQVHDIPSELLCYSLIYTFIHSILPPFIHYPFHSCVLCSLIKQCLVFHFVIVSAELSQSRPLSFGDKTAP